MTNQKQRTVSRIPRVKNSRDEDPKLIGQWKIGRTIGKGSSGRVKIARHVITHQYAAIKIVSKTALINSRLSVAEAPAHAERILLGIEREIVIMKLIDHPNVLELYDVWETTNELYLIMEYVEGGELFDYLVSRGRIPVSEALHYFQQIISAISYCHGFNIAHRDLKPENLLLSTSDSRRNIKVADFGMAAYTDPTSLLSTSCGSPHYASPEVVEGKAYRGSISDIWSCGVILYALLVGRLPFDHENLRILLEKVKVATYEMPRDIPPGARDLISRMLEKDVTRRITMAQIQKHPFFLSATPSLSLSLDAQTPTLGQLVSETYKPVQREEDIDADIFDNLRTLWHGAPALDIIEGLLNDEKTWEKAVYHLLVKYRSKHLENYNMDDDDIGRQRNQQEAPSVDEDPPEPTQQPDNLIAKTDKKQAAHLTKEILSCSGETVSSSPLLRPNAPTPKRAIRNKKAGSRERDGSDDATSDQDISKTSNPITPQPPVLPALGIGLDVCTTGTPHDPVTGSNEILPPPVVQTLPIINVPTLPLINLQEAIPSRIHQHPKQSSSLLNSSSPLSPSPILGLPGLAIPNLDNVDETVQKFFYQIVEHLNMMQKRQSSASSHSSSVTPEPSLSGSSASNPTQKLGSTEVYRLYKSQIADTPYRAQRRSSPLDDFDPDDSRFEDATEESMALPVTVINLGLGISNQRSGAIRLSPTPYIPFQLPNPPGRRYSSAGGRDSDKNSAKNYKADSGDKENLKAISVQDEVKVRKKSSLRKAEDKRKSLGDKHVQILIPHGEIKEEKVKARKSILSTRTTENSPTILDSPFFPGGLTPRRSWFANLFKFRPATHHLLSVYDAHITRGECARLLRTFGVVVIFTDIEGSGVLKCKLDEIKDPVGVMSAKAIKFRVELHNISHAQAVSGYATSLTMVQEKGALSSFKLVYNRLRREWDLDTPPSSRALSSAC